MKSSLIGSLPKVAFGLLLASGITTGIVAASAQPAQAGVVVSVGIGGGYAPAPAYHWARWHDGYGWHRRWAPVGWAPAYGYAARPAYYARPVYYARPIYDAPWRHGDERHYAAWHRGYGRDDRHGYR